MHGIVVQGEPQSCLVPFSVAWGMAGDDMTWHHVHLPLLNSPLQLPCNWVRGNAKAQTSSCIGTVGLHVSGSQDQQAASIMGCDLCRPNS